ncbi:MAG: ABC-2 family transporter protein, partial [Lachnospiraceae bacterium]|nr:ABC-2 family transporter protein [Lachnospiraceae bacterium]
AFKSLVSGSLIPISMFPPLLRIITEFLPTKFYIYTPVDALLNGTDALTLAVNILLAMCWIVILVTLSVVQWNNGIKRLQMNIN